MIRRAMAAATLATTLAAGACQRADAAKAARADSATLAERESRLEQSLSQRDTSPGGITAERKPVARWVLPSSLDEISGIALTPDGRLLAEQDERAQISEIDYRRGVITKQFVVGSPTIEADFEAIAVVGDVIYLLESNGTIYEFREGNNGARVDYTTHDTRLGKECEFEGMAYDSTLNALLLACKNVGTKHLRDSMVIYRWKLQGGGDRISMLTVPLSALLPSMGKKEFHPSDITVDPFSGNYVIIGSAEKGIVEITPAGQVIFARKLPGDHDQPESIAITRDSLLIIGDEAKNRPAVLTLYPWP